MQRKYLGLLLLAAIWTAVLARPATRDILAAQLSSRGSWPPSVFPAPDYAPGDLQYLTRRYPNNLNVLVAAEAGGDAKKQCQVYDRLIRSFPDQAWLIAARLRHTFRWLRHDRVGGELSDPDYPTHAAKGIPSPERKGKPNFTPQELREAIALCHKGQQREPDNAYFDWMLTYFLLAGYRDKEAFDVLSQGALKPRYNAYSTKEPEALVAARQLEGPLLWEKKVAIAATDLGDFSAAAKYRELARLITWQGIKAQRRGDHRQALRIYGGLLRMCVRIREGSSTYIGGLVARALEAMAWAGPFHASRNSTPVRSSRQQRNASFQQYATAHARTDLARAAAREIKASDFYVQQIRQGINSIYGTSHEAVAGISLLWHTSFLLLLAFLASLLLWLLLTLALRLRPLRNIVGASGNAVLQRRDIVRGVLVCSSGVLLLLVCDNLDALRGDLQDIWDGITTTSTFDWSVMGFSIRASTLIEHYRWLLALTPALYGALACIAAATRRQPRSAGLEIPWHQRLKAAMQDFDLTFLVTLIANCSLAFALPLLWIALAVWPQDIELMPVVPAWAIALFFLFCLSWPLGQSFRLPQRRAALGYGLRAYRQTLAIWLIAGSVCYLTFALVSLPLRRAADRRIDAIIRYGEVRADAMMR